MRTVTPKVVGKSFDNNTLSDSEFAIRPFLLRTEMTKKTSLRECKELFL